ncbi:hypothetical protein [Geothermobacter ehrlichii]|uniref:hypothetical protein n=1 Tax=Geothermobacter ehrlichii TaxID=213224 RepID=UPI0038B27256
MVFSRSPFRAGEVIFAIDLGIILATALVFHRVEPALWSLVSLCDLALHRCCSRWRAAGEGGFRRAAGGWRCASLQARGGRRRRPLRPAFLLRRAAAVSREADGRRCGACGSRRRGSGPFRPAAARRRSGRD